MKLQFNLNVVVTRVCAHRLDGTEVFVFVIVCCTHFQGGCCASVYYFAECCLKSGGGGSSNPSPTTTTTVAPSHKLPCSFRERETANCRNGGQCFVVLLRGYRSTVCRCRSFVLHSRSLGITL